MGGWGIAMSALAGGIAGGLASVVLRAIKIKNEKKQSRIIIIVVIVIVSIGTSTFLSTNVRGEPKEKLFSKAGMTITLTDKFYEKDLVAYTAYYESETSIVLMVKEEFALFDEAEVQTDISLYEYAKIVGKNNNDDWVVKEKDELTYSEFDNTVNGKRFSYFVVFFRSNDAYWFVQFACESKNYEKYSDDFFKWAKSFKV